MAGGTGFQAMVTVATPVTRLTAAITDSQSKTLRWGSEMGFRRFRMALTRHVILPSGNNSRNRVGFTIEKEAALGRPQRKLHRDATLPGVKAARSHARLKCLCGYS